jgi:hypothetical protein
VKPLSLNPPAPMIAAIAIASFTDAVFLGEDAAP